jgi:hypothetical protein
VHGIVDELKDAFVPCVTIEYTAKETTLGEIALKRVAQAGDEQTLLPFIPCKGFDEAHVDLRVWAGDRASGSD